MRVGRVLGTEYDENRDMTMIHAFVVQRFAHHVRQGTRFYRGGGLNFSLGGGGVSASGLSLASLMSAPVSFYTPDVMAGMPVSNGTHFQLHGSENSAIAAADGPHLTYLVYFPGPLRGLTPGTPVQMKGVQVGRVREVRLRYLPETASLETPVTIEIDPRRLEFPITDATTREELRGTLNDALDKMIRKGMRASLATSLVLPGASAVALENVAGAGAARLIVTSDPPIIPAAAAGSGLEGAMSAIGDVANTIRSLPIREIANDLRSASQRVNALVNDPVLDQSLRRLDRSLAEVERVTSIAGNNAQPIVESLRNAANSAESAAKTVESTVATTSESIGPIVESLRNAATSAEAAAARVEQLAGTSARQNYDLGELIKEITRAAEAVRALADYLNENPDALLKGRAKSP
jgi:paraquat-inducible protein B